MHEVTYDLRVVPHDVFTKRVPCIANSIMPLLEKTGTIPTCGTGVSAAINSLMNPKLWFCGIDYIERLSVMQRRFAKLIYKPQHVALNRKHNVTSVLPKGSTFIAAIWPKRSDKAYLHGLSSIRLALWANDRGNSAAAKNL